ncbi:hypothetical protein MTX26_21290 [Bradyrhizobium sp. ISRA443]|uniref:hypothetical protein n=1 Tax=unclassified Bradyrhizobium TaxID=2631580 RepID=UPI002479BB38|nr:MULTISPECIES: hypothetical protein [unclassified Bradyrhizobium]WGR96981.1 hypothetical protein MTX23_21290 [Bradyrhizobium sp. ISRA436]WGS03868.1 hypothetical protein MTX18_21290 [Bradyrhizobium sp. ISRA437]WGS10752.1 hypothetical protein MTX26_21290 [Bradyrhizobium sp. ISRA443]
MRRVIAIAVAGLSLAGCSSFSLDSFKSAPPPMQVQLDSAPQGADAVTSLGPGCKTPCSVSVPAPEANFSVTFNLPKYQPETVPVTVTRTPGDFTTPTTTTLDPSPVFAELKLAGPPPRAARKMHPKRKKPKPAAAAPTAAGSSPFPEPNAAPPPASAAPPPAAAAPTQ